MRSAILCLLVCAPCLRAEDLREQVDPLAEPLLKDRENVGFVIGILKDGKTQFFGYGKVHTASGEQTPNAETMFEIGSITKTFTGVLLAEAVLRKEVKLGDEANTHLPERFRIQTKLDKPITLQHLATHQSGLPSFPLVHSLSTRNQKNPYLDLDDKVLSAFCAKFEKIREPDEKYGYSNIGMGLLGHALVHVAKVGSYDELVRERICKPLKLHDTSEALTGAQKNRMARPHDEKGKPVECWDFATLPACGAIRSTASDMLKYAAANFGEGKPAIYPAMQMSHKEFAKSDVKVTTVGLGWHRRELKTKQLCLWHNGQTGGFKSMLAITPETKCAVIVLCAHTGVKEVDAIAMKLLEMLQPGE